MEMLSLSHLTYVWQDKLNLNLPSLINIQLLIYMTKGIMVEQFLSW